jgi:hypothetical protein
MWEFIGILFSMLPSLLKWNTTLSYSQLLTVTTKVQYTYKAPCSLCHSVHKLIMDGWLYKEPASCNAVLSFVEEHTALALQ